jgi:hypothetical protein
MLEAFETPRVAALGMFRALREMLRVNKEFVLQNEKKFASLTEVVQAYLRGTAFAKLLEQRIPISIPDWTLSMLVTAATGSLKTQLLQTTLVYHLLQPKPPTWMCPASPKTRATKYSTSYRSYSQTCSVRASRR